MCSYLIWDTWAKHYLVEDYPYNKSTIITVFVYSPLKFSFATNMSGEAVKKVSVTPSYDILS